MTYSVTVSINSENRAVLTSNRKTQPCIVKHSQSVTMSALRFLLWFCCIIFSYLKINDKWYWGSCGSEFRASAFLSEGCRFNSSVLHVDASLGKILNPKVLLMCWSAPRMPASAISVWMYVWTTASRAGQMRLLNAPKCKLFTSPKKKHTMLSGCITLWS